REDDWLEMPFWAWRAGEGRRRRLLARSTSSGWQLRAGDDVWPALPGNADDPEMLVAAWQNLEPQGFKVRFRALTTTLYTRLFLHGIGGAKYDELTDELMRRFFGIEPPGFLTLTGTLLLPFPRADVTPEDCRRLAQEHRDLWWNPQRHLPQSEVNRAVQDLLR